MIPITCDTLGGDAHSAQLTEMSNTELQLRTIALLEKIARSQRVLERRIDTIETALSQPATAAAATQPAAAPTFPQFRQMPPEIRDRVWSLAMPTRALRLRRSDTSAFIPTLRPPAVAETCREARAVATRHGGMVSVTNHHGQSGPGTKSTKARAYWTWFDSHHDVLELERWVSLERDEPRGIRALAREARHILAPRADAEWFARLFEQATSVRRVSLKFDTCVASRCAWEPGVVKRLFGDGASTVEILDLEDAGEIARIKGILREHWQCPFFCEFDLEGWAASRANMSDAGRGRRDEKWMRRLDGTWMSEVARGWVMARAARSRTAAAEAEAPAEAKAGMAAAMDVEDAGVRAALAAMPEVRLVRAYLLADVHSTR